MSSIVPSFSRRSAIKWSILAGAGLALSRSPLTSFAATSAGSIIKKRIPSSGEEIPVVGLGTNNFNVTKPEDIAARREVLRRLPELGGAVVDTARGYGRSELVIGELVQELGNRKQLFLATKVMAPQNDLAAGQTQLKEAFERLRMDVIDLMFVHSLNGTDVLMPVLRDMKKTGKIRYCGTTTSDDRQYPRLIEVMKKESMDVIQVDYSLGNRDAADVILPLAQDRGMAVLLNVPFGGRRATNMFARVANRPLPEWAAEFDAKTWAQFFLKYIVSHPATTCAIPGTAQARHLEDNLGGARGRLPDQAMRRRMEQYWDALPG